MERPGKILFKIHFRDVQDPKGRLVSLVLTVSPVILAFLVFLVHQVLVDPKEIVVMLEGVVEQTGNSIQVNIAGSDAST